MMLYLALTIKGIIMLNGILIKPLKIKDMKRLYQILDVDGYDPIGQALTWDEVQEIIKEYPNYTYREYTPIN